MTAKGVKRDSYELCADWQYDEMKQIGTDYENEAEVEDYDQRMQKLRDIQGDIKRIIDLLELQPDQVALEMGAGTGEMAVAMAGRCFRVYAVDVSGPMLRYAKKKAEARGISNIEFIQAGFLTYEHNGRPLNAIVSQLALHHLPDFWKQVALLRISDMLKEGGRLYLEDVTYSFPPREWTAFLNEFIDGISRLRGEDGVEDIVGHIKNEYSTFSWVMEGMIKRAGFRIEGREYKDGFRAAYICTKV